MGEYSILLFSKNNGNTKCVNPVLMTCRRLCFLYSVDRGIVGGWLHFIVIGQELERPVGGAVCV